MTGLFAQASVAGADGFTVIPGGWLDRNYIQLAHQLADSCATFGYSFVMTVSLTCCYMLIVFAEYDAVVDHLLCDAYHPWP